MNYEAPRVDARSHVFCSRLFAINGMRDSRSFWSPLIRGRPRDVPEMAVRGVLFEVLELTDDYVFYWSDRRASPSVDLTIAFQVTPLASTPARGTNHHNEEGRVFPFDVLPPLADLLKQREGAIINHVSMAHRPCWPRVRYPHGVLREEPTQLFSLVG